MELDEVLKEMRMGEVKQAGLSVGELEQRGIEAVENGSVAEGRELLESIPPSLRSLSVVTYLAWCGAGRGAVEEGLSICTEALSLEPSNMVHYLNMGRILVVAGEKKEAIRIFRNGLLFGESRLIRKEMDKLGWRNPPMFPSLGREHVVNRLFGRFRKKLV